MGSQSLNITALLSYSTGNQESATYLSMVVSKLLEITVGESHISYMRM